MNVQSTEIIESILVKARSLIKSRERWIKRHLATNSAGHRVNPESSGACRFCASGAITRAAFDLGDMRYRIGAIRLIGNVLNQKEGCPKAISSFNDDDNTSHEDILKLFDKAIAKCKTH